MVSSDLIKRVLAALAEGLPADVPNVLTKVEISTGWGDVVVVKIQSAASRSEGSNLRAKVTQAIDDALGDQRHVVSIEWVARA